MKFKVAVIGAGYFGQKHIKVLNEMPDVEIVGIVDKDITKAQEIAKQYNLRYYSDYRELLNLAQIFFVVTPTITHFEIGMELINNGKAIFIEKPLTEKPLFAEKLLNEAANRNVIIQTGLIERYNPVVRSIIQHLDSPIFIQTERTSPFLARATDTDVTYDLMIHDIDLIWMLLKISENFKLKDLKVLKKSLVTSRIDYASVWMEFVSSNFNVKAHLTASRVSYGFSRKISIVQQNDILYADLINRTLTKVDKEGKVTEIYIKNRDSQPLYEEIRDFLNSVKQNKPSTYAPSPKEIIDVIEIIDKINGGQSSP
ncbi:MAG: Gfo/Idh/MocA family oxidoreductase [Thermodesulfovibrio sp.]|nr:Gfo/Idh/MocA family oxidoreductase [Thermodesulfovibrio sp.]MCX7723761.1 Gfo/Idh/MocA family oxidoreductase [Thermodesulfovibrio sp.]MDW7972060.1 Gfo/Idh/MocA family oxidoreductase [Thermodesulfovibrio sp.]